MSIEMQILQKALSSKHSGQYTNLKKVMRSLDTFLDQFIHLYKNKKLIDISFFPDYKDSKCKFIYLSEIAEKTNTDRQYACRKINCLCTLNLLEKVDTSKLNSVTVTNTIKLAKSKGMEPPNYFFIPKYNKELFLEAENRAKKLIENGFTLRNFNKTMVRNALGEEIEKSVFINNHDFKTQKITLSNNERKKNIKISKAKEENQYSNINILKHFNYISVPNEHNENIVDINVFNRPEKYVECIGYTNYLMKLNFKKLVLDFLGIHSYISEDFLTPLQKALKRYNFNSFSKTEQLKYKWLIYDYTNYKVSPILYQNNKCFKKYFIDAKDIKILKKHKNKQFIFNTDGYLVEYPNPDSNINWHQFYHIYVYDNFDSSKRYKKSTKTNIDHLQKAPIYLYDTSIKSLLYSNMQFSNKKITKRIVRELLDYKIIESWNNVLSNIYEAKSDNCKYNLKQVSCAENSRKKWKIDNNNIIEIYKSPQIPNEFYVSFYFSEKKKLEVHGEIYGIYALSIKYNTLNQTYESILSDLYKFNIPVDTGVNYANLFKYIQGKDILFIIDINNDNYAEAMSKTKTPITAETDKVTLVENYKSSNKIFLE